MTTTKRNGRGISSALVKTLLSDNRTKATIGCFRSSMAAHSDKEPSLKNSSLEIYNDYAVTKCVLKSKQTKLTSETCWPQMKILL